MTPDTSTLRTLGIVSLLLLPAVASAVGVDPGAPVTPGVPAAGDALSPVVPEGCVEPVRYHEAVGEACRTARGTYRYQTSDGRWFHTHGPDHFADAADEDEYVPVRMKPRCVHDRYDPNEAHIRVVYAVPHDRENRWPAIDGTIRRIIEEAQGHLYSEAQATGGGAYLRVLCLPGTADIWISAVTLNGVSGNSDDFAQIKSAILAMPGFDDPNANVLVIYDDETGTGSGQGDAPQDSRRAADNKANEGGQFAMAWKNGHDWDTVLHEIGHNLGAVQDDAPDSNGLDHCNDDDDVMCYDESHKPGFVGTYEDDVCYIRPRWDCDRDTYFHMDPPAGSYLQTHWNMAWQANRFLDLIGGWNDYPQAPVIDCPSFSEDVHATCILRADDQSRGVRFEVDWGDGTPVSYTEGFVRPGTNATLRHRYANTGEYVINARAIDSATPAAYSGASSVWVWVDPNQPPDVPSFACPEAAFRSFLVCTTSIVDPDSRIWVEVDWGDGTTSRVPPWNDLPAANITKLEHFPRAPGERYVTMRVFEYGDIHPAAEVTTSARVNADPIIAKADCVTDPLTVGVDTICYFGAADDSASIRYDVDWGDGTSSSVSTQPGKTIDIKHNWSSAGVKEIKVRVSDNGAGSLSDNASFTQSIVANTPPTVTSFSCDDTLARSRTTCRFVATDTTATGGVYYTLRWSDNVTTRVPASGYAQPGVTQSVGRFFATLGTRMVEIRATDALGSTSAKKTDDVHVTAGHLAPVVTQFACAPDPVFEDRAVSCTLQATDDSAVLFFLVDWGDGLQERFPPSDFATVPANGTYTLAHAYADPQTYHPKVTAYDIQPFRISLGSVPKTDVLYVRANSAPVVTLLKCPASYEDESVQCLFLAVDDQPAPAPVAFEIDWGDGTKERFPATGYTKTSTTIGRTHAWPDGKRYTVSVRALDAEPVPLTGAARTWDQHVKPNLPPAITDFACSPLSLTVGESVTCSFRATDDRSHVRYTMDWGDGEATDVPLGPPGTLRTLTHAYTTVAVRTLSLTAIDAGLPPLPSDPRTAEIDVTPPCDETHAGHFVLGLGKIKIDNLSSTWITGLPRWCWQDAAQLQLYQNAGNIAMVTGCWHDREERLLGCFDVMDSVVDVPRGATQLRVHATTGFDFDWRLVMEETSTYPG